MADPIDLAHYGRALHTYRRDLVAWTLLYGAYAAVSLATFGLGLVLAPNVFRATRDAIAEDAPPRLGTLFQTDRIADDAIVMLATFGATTVTSWVLGPLSAVVGLLLGFAPPLVADGRYGAVDALKLSVARVMEAPLPALAHGVVGALVALPGVCCLLPLPFVLPIAGIATWLFYLQQRDAFDALATKQGIRALAERD